MDSPRRRRENMQSPHRTAPWGFKPTAFLPLGNTPREAECGVATGICCHVTLVERRNKETRHSYKFMKERVYCRSVRMLPVLLNLIHH